MKYSILYITTILLLSSCSYQNIKINLLPESNSSAKEQDSSFREIQIIDNRKNKLLIGTKQLGTKTIEITSTQNLKPLIKSKIIKYLKDSNLSITKKIELKIYIEKLSYHSKRGFIVGKSNLQIRLKASVLQNNNIKFNKTYNITKAQAHFVSSSKKSDQKIISSTLELIINNIIANKELSNIWVKTGNFRLQTNT